MNQTTQLLNAIKKCLKAKGITYKFLSEKLGLSEASVKRLFSEQSFSLKRIEEVCNILDLNFLELARISMDEDAVPNVLTLDQENDLAGNPKLLVYFYLLLNGREPSSIIADYDFSPEESMKFLLNLDKLRLIDLYPDNKIRFLTERTIVWRKNGPIREKYEKMIIEEFLNYQFDRSEDRLYFETGKLSTASRAMVMKKIDRLIKEYNELRDIDKTLPQEKIDHTGLMIAFRPWVFSLTENYKR